MKHNGNIFCDEIDWQSLSDKQKIKLLTLRCKNDEFYVKYLENQLTRAGICQRPINKWDVLRYFKRKTPKSIKFIFRPLYKLLYKIFKKMQKYEFFRKMLKI